MSTQITMDLPDEVYARASRLASLTQRKLSDVVVDTLRLTLPTLVQSPIDEVSVHKLSNEIILQWTQLEMESKEDKRMSYLLDRQQKGILSEVERMELARLMQIYQDGLLRKAQGLAEAVRRGLISSLEP